MMTEKQARNRTESDQAVRRQGGVHGRVHARKRGSHVGAVREANLALC